MLKDLVIHIRLFNSFPQVFPMRNRLNAQKSATVIFAGFLVLSSAIAAPAQATESEKRPSSIKYQILLQSGTTVPGSDRPLVALSDASISGQNIAFFGATAPFVSSTQPSVYGNGQRITTSRLTGIYSLFGGKVGTIRQVENQETQGPVPPDFRSIVYKLTAPVIDRQDVAFTEEITNRGQDGRGSFDSTIWALRSGKLSTLITCRYSLRDGSFGPSSTLALNQKDVVATGNGGGCPVGIGNSEISRFRQGTRETITKSVEPNSLYFQSLKLSGEKILFSQQNLYLTQKGQLSKIFQLGQPAPIQKFTTDGLCGYDIKGNRIVFCVSAQNKGSEIVLRVGNQTKPVVTSQMTVPGESRKFSNLASPSISGENILFVENDDVGPVKAIYVKRENKILKIVGVGSALNGSTVTGLNLGTSPISGEQVVFGAKLSNGKSALVKAQF
jgi:hypothetical protein